MYVIFVILGLEYVIEIQEKGSQEGAWYSCRQDVYFEIKWTVYNISSDPLFLSTLDAQRYSLKLCLIKNA